MSFTAAHTAELLNKLYQFCNVYPSVMMPSHEVPYSAGYYETLITIARDIRNTLILLRLIMKHNQPSVGDRGKIPEDSLYSSLDYNPVTRSVHSLHHVYATTAVSSMDQMRVYEERMLDIIRQHTSHIQSISISSDEEVTTAMTDWIPTIQFIFQYLHNEYSV